MKRAHYQAQNILLSWLLSLFILNVFLIVHIVGDATSPVPRYGHVSVLIGSKIFIIGGVQSQTTQPLDELWMLDLEDPQFKTTSPTWINVKNSVTGLTVPNTTGGTACSVNTTIYLFGGIISLNNSEWVGHFKILQFI